MISTPLAPNTAVAPSSSIRRHFFASDEHTRPGRPGNQPCSVLMAIANRLSAATRRYSVASHSAVLLLPRRRLSSSSPSPSPSTSRGLDGGPFPPAPASRRRRRHRRSRSLPRRDGVGAANCIPSVRSRLPPWRRRSLRLRLRPLPRRRGHRPWTLEDPLLRCAKRTPAYVFGSRRISTSQEGATMVS